MRTPAGNECKFFYGDYFRGRSQEECRLLKDNGISWSPYLCQECPVPEILQANSCSHQRLNPQLKRPVFFMRAQVVVEAYCTKAENVVKEPRIGCGQCHPTLKEFVIAPNEPDSTDRS